LHYKLKMEKNHFFHFIYNKNINLKIINNMKTNLVNNYYENLNDDLLRINRMGKYC
jgi:aspartyl aminopeptidase